MIKTKKHQIYSTVLMSVLCGEHSKQVEQKPEPPMALLRRRCNEAFTCIRTLISRFVVFLIPTLRSEQRIGRRIDRRMGGLANRWTNEPSPRLKVRSGRNIA